jgi:hypothetical protein
MTSFVGNLLGLQVLFAMSELLSLFTSHYFTFTINFLFFIFMKISMNLKENALFILTIYRIIPLIDNAIYSELNCKRFSFHGLFTILMIILKKE